MHAHDLEGREEPVFDPLLQRIGVERIAEVGGVVRAVLLVGGRGEADLNRRLEVLQDLAPAAFLRRAPAVALVDDDEVEVVPRDLAEVVRKGLPAAAVLAALQLLIESEVDAVARIDLAPLNLRLDALEGREVADDRLVMYVIVSIQNT